MHLPRTGGTSTAAWVRAIKEFCNLAVEIDSCNHPYKHDNLSIRGYRDGCVFDGSIIAMNFRSLPAWLESNFKWTVMSGFKLPLERYLGGEFFSFRTGRWCPADWWLEYFEVEKVTHFLRCDNLESDWRHFLRSIAEIDMPFDIGMQRLNGGLSASTTDLSPMFAQNASKLYMRNPIWELTEKKLLITHVG